MLEKLLCKILARTNIKKKEKKMSMKTRKKCPQKLFIISPHFFSVLPKMTWLKTHIAFLMFPILVTNIWTHYDYELTQND